jgi:hypothetical protein
MHGLGRGERSRAGDAQPLRSLGGISVARLSPTSLLAAVFLVKPLVTLVHELGHAAVALRVSSGIVVMLVGKPSTAFQVLFERLKVIWSPVPERLTLSLRPAGVCRYDQANVKPRDKTLVTLAGPLATALLIPVFIWATVECAGMSQWIPATWGLSALGAFVSCLYNLDPRPANDAERAALDKPRRGGPKALAVYRAWRNEGDIWKTNP